MEDEKYIYMFITTPKIMSTKLWEFGKHLWYKQKVY